MAQEKKNTNSVCHVDVRRGDLLALLAGLCDLLHVPDAEGGSTQLAPDVDPALVLRGPLSVWLALDPADERAREVDLVGMSQVEMDDGADFGMEGLGGLHACGRHRRDTI